MAGMTEPASPRRFHEADRLEDRRVVGEEACAHLRTGRSRAGAGSCRRSASWPHTTMHVAAAQGSSIPVFDLTDEAWLGLDSIVDRTGEGSE